MDISVENIISYIIYIFFVLFFSYIIKKSNNMKQVKYVLITYLFVLSILSFFFNPSIVIDLTRYQSSLKSYENLDFLRLLKILTKSANYSELFYFWIISKIGFKQLIQTFSVFIYYLVIFYIIYDFSNQYNISFKTQSRVLLFFMLLGQYVFVASLVPTSIAFSIFVFCCYREYFKNKNFYSHLPFYLLSIGFHICVIPLFICRMFIVLFDKKTNKLNQFINYFIVFVIVYIAYNYNTILITSFLQKSNAYLNKIIYYNKAEYIIATLTDIIILMSLYINYKFIKNKKEFLFLKSYKKNIYMILMIIVVFSTEYSIFTRYSNFLTMINLPIIILSLEHDLKKSDKKYNYSLMYILYIILMILIILVSYLKGNMSVTRFIFM